MPSRWRTSRSALSGREAEAEAFVGALVPLASKLIPRAAKLIAKNAPTLVKGASRIARQLRRNPQTRRLVRGLPVVLQRTAQSLANQAANGQDIDATTVVRTLGTMTGRVLRAAPSPAGDRRREHVQPSLPPARQVGSRSRTASGPHPRSRRSPSGLPGPGASPGEPAGGPPCPSSLSGSALANPCPSPGCGGPTPRVRASRWPGSPTPLASFATGQGVNVRRHLEALRDFRRGGSARRSRDRPRDTSSP